MVNPPPRRIPTLAAAAGRDELRKCIERACADTELVAAIFKDPAAVGARQVIYADKKHGFNILAHVFEGASGSNPHDHGPTWAIYGQVAVPAL